MIMKNRFMRAAMLLLALVLVSTCAVGGTFAKYQTTGSSNDSARVAKWGVTITAANADALFANEYDSSANATVKSEVDVVAPGTSGTFGGFTVTGTPEVSSQVSYTAVVDLTGHWEDEDGDFYFPLTITVGGQTVDLTDITTGTDVENAIKTAIEKQSANFTPGQNVSAPLTFGWNWAIGEASQADTRLGDIAAGKIEGKTAPNISITVTAKITQID